MKISLLGDIVGRFCLWSITSKTGEMEYGSSTSIANELAFFTHFLSPSENDSSVEEKIVSLTHEKEELQQLIIQMEKRTQQKDQQPDKFQYDWKHGAV